MKQFNVLLIALFIAIQGFLVPVVAQPKSLMYLRQRADANLKYLVADQRARDRVRINETGISFLGENGNVEFTSYWTEASEVVSAFENLSYSELQEWYDVKANNHSEEISKKFEYYVEYPTKWDDLRIALDPGHFGGDLEKSLEKRFVKIKKENGAEISFNEADLNYYTYLMIKDKLIGKGVPASNIFNTRTKNDGAIGVDFLSFLENHFDEVAAQGIRQGWLEKVKADDLIAMYKGVNAPLANLLNDTTIRKSKLALFNFYRNVDLRERAKLINFSRPQITIIIHYNASENGNPDEKGFLKTTNENYNSIIVPGGFLGNELKQVESKMNFIRLLLSPDLANSIRLADNVLGTQERILKVPRLPFGLLDKSSSQNSKQTPFEGVYSRNLYLTMATRGPVIYGESLYQDNVNESELLSRGDVEVTDQDGKKYMAPKRCEQIAEGYIQGITLYLNQNKSLANNQRPK